MSKSLSSVAQQEFDSMVHHLFQSAGRIMPEASQYRSGVVADIYKFRTIGKGMASQKASQADVVPLDVTHTLVNCVLENWHASEFTDIFDQQEVNFDEKSELAKTIANALGRRKDQLHIDALDDSTPVATIDTNVGGAGTGFNVDKIRAAGAALDNQGVDEEGRYIVANTRCKWTLLGETEVSSSDYNTVKALAHGMASDFAGFKFIWIPDNEEGGITSASNVYDNYAFHRSAVGCAVGIDMRTEIEYQGIKTSWLCNGLMKAGAVAVDETGIVKVQATET